MNLFYDSRPDFGFYDALNRAIKISSGEYYIVLGSDDLLYNDAIENYTSFIDKNPDIVMSSVQIEGRFIISPKIHKYKCINYEPFKGWHSVGMLIKKSLHGRIGYYSNKYPIAADTYFIKKAIYEGCRIELAEFVAGVFGTSGVSSTNYLRVLCESFQVSLAVGENKAMHLFVFILKLLKNFRRL